MWPKTLPTGSYLITWTKIITVFSHLVVLLKPMHLFIHLIDTIHQNTQIYTLQHYLLAGQTKMNISFIPIELNSIVVKEDCTSSWKIELKCMGQLYSLFHLMNQRSCRVQLGLTVAFIGSSQDVEVSIHSPFFSPAICNGPIWQSRLWIDSPANYTNSMSSSQTYEIS